MIATKRGKLIWNRCASFFTKDNSIRPQGGKISPWIPDSTMLGIIYHACEFPAPITSRFRSRLTHQKPRAVHWPVTFHEIKSILDDAKSIFMSSNLFWGTWSLKKPLINIPYRSRRHWAGSTLQYGGVDLSRSVKVESRAGGIHGCTKRHFSR